MNLSELKFQTYAPCYDRWELGRYTAKDFKKLIKGYCQELGHSLTFRAEDKEGKVRQGEIIVLKADGYGSEYQVSYAGLVTDGVVSDPIKELTRIVKMF